MVKMLTEFCHTGPTVWLLMWNCRMLLLSHGDRKLSGQSGGRAGRLGKAQGAVQGMLETLVPLSVSAVSWDACESELSKPHALNTCYLSHVDRPSRKRPAEEKGHDEK